MPSVVDRPSPNHGPRRPDAPIDILLVHYTGMPTLDSALALLCGATSGVSAHYTIALDGTVYRHVDEERRAWHAGAGFWRGERDINSRSIGIELENPGFEWGYHPFETAQMAAFRQLAHEIIARHRIPPERVLGHSDVACARKQDPGIYFAWQTLATDGIGLWPRPEAVDDGPERPGELEHLLEGYGYDLRFGSGPPLVAFRRHFHPGALGTLDDPETVRRVRALIRQTGSVPDPSQGLTA